ncbi:hypothetical protein C1H46_025101 [Malus baccata]|uniref:Uncharacterized protein n=1 Tax=Malus baccata TaxID=106549 RepID=A0A540LS79_MALBA|nr:hypothetical protein C1H46_025101 [Malus baccata]
MESGILDGICFSSSGPRSIPTPISPHRHHQTQTTTDSPPLSPITTVVTKTTPSSIDSLLHASSPLRFFHPHSVTLHQSSPPPLRHHCRHESGPGDHHDSSATSIVFLESSTTSQI